MNELDLIIAYSNINLMIEQLDQWNDKKPNKKLELLKSKLQASEETFRKLEQMYLQVSKNNSALSLKLIEHEN